MRVVNARYSNDLRKPFLSASVACYVAKWRNKLIVVFIARKLRGNETAGQDTWFRKFRLA